MDNIELIESPYKDLVVIERSDHVNESDLWLALLR